MECESAILFNLVRFCANKSILSTPEGHGIQEVSGSIPLVPQTKDIGDVSENYIKFVAFNQLYLSASRAKYRLILLGNELHGPSPCLQYAIESKCLVMGQ
jgi:hypothetical protein